MTKIQIRDPETYEPFGIVLTTNPELWAEWEDDTPQFDNPEHEHNWAELFGLDED